MSENPDATQARPGFQRHSTEPGRDCAYVQELVAPYVMAALEPDEHRRIDRHRNRCVTCEQLIAETRETISYLAFSVSLVAPPARAKASLMDRIAQAAQVEANFPQPALAAATTPAGRSLTIPSSRGLLAPIPEGWEEANRSQPQLEPERSGLSRRLRANWHLLATPLATVPLVLALGIVGVWAMNTQDRLSARSAEIQSLNLQVNTLSNRLDTVNDALADVDQFMVAQDAMRYDMAPGTASSSKAVGQVIANPGTDQAMLVVKGLSGSHAMYEVLLESSAGSLVSAGELPVSADGAGKAVLELSQPFSSYRSVHVKPKSDLTNQTVTDSNAVTVPDALYGVIDPNLGSSGDTDVPDAGQSN
ncbi:MAG TPA: hypothetical protein VKB09_12355 [Thermomicrobiales bacterium]|nr:hypothetical protein [Thermomicrobiales bacterium]